MDFKTFFKKFKRMFFQLSQNVEAKAEAAPARKLSLGSPKPDTTGK